MRIPWSFQMRSRLRMQDFLILHFAPFYVFTSWLAISHPTALATSTSHTPWYARIGTDPAATTTTLILGAKTKTYVVENWSHAFTALLTPIFARAIKDEPPIPQVHHGRKRPVGDLGLLLSPSNRTCPRIVSPRPASPPCLPFQSPFQQAVP